MLRIFDSDGIFVGEILGDSDPSGILFFPIFGLILFVIIGTVLGVIKNYWYVFVGAVFLAVIILTSLALLIHKVLNSLHIYALAINCVKIISTLFFFLFAYLGFPEEESAIRQDGWFNTIIVYICYLLLLTIFLVISSIVSQIIAEKIVIQMMLKQFKLTRVYKNLICFFDDKINQYAYQSNSKSNFQLNFTIKYDSIMETSLSQFGMEKFSSFEEIIMISKIIIDIIKKGKKPCKYKIKRHYFGDKSCDNIEINLLLKESVKKRRFCYRKTGW